MAKLKTRINPDHPQMLLEKLVYRTSLPAVLYWFLHKVETEYVDNRRRMEFPGEGLEKLLGKIQYSYRFACDGFGRQKPDKSLTTEVTAILNKHGLTESLFCLSEICMLKAEHIEQSYDTKTSDVWVRCSSFIESCAQESQQLLNTGVRNNPSRRTIPVKFTDECLHNNHPQTDNGWVCTYHDTAHERGECKHINTGHIFMWMKAYGSGKDGEVNGTLYDKRMKPYNDSFGWWRTNDPVHAANLAFNQYAYATGNR